MTTKAKIRKWIKRITYMIVMGCFFVIYMFPFFFILTTSFKLEKNALSIPIHYFPDAIENPFTFENYINAWLDSNFALYFLNTLLISIIVLLFCSFFSLMVGYTLSRYNFAGKNITMTILIVTQIVPSTLLLIPLFTIFQSLGLINSRFGVALAISAPFIAYCSIMMKTFFSTISIQLEEAAWIDGCNKWQAVVKVIFPLVLPGLVAVGAFAFVGAWNNFILPLILLTDQKKSTLTLGLKSLIGQYSIEYTRLAAAGVICLIPAIAWFAYIQKYLVGGLTTGAVKG